MYNIDIESEWQNDNQKLNRTEYGISRMTNVIKCRKNGLITKREYNAYRKAIEQFLNL